MVGKKIDFIAAFSGSADLTTFHDDNRDGGYRSVRGRLSHGGLNHASGSIAFKRNSGHSVQSRNRPRLEIRLTLPHGET